MTEKLTELNNDEINVEKIMEKIRENIQKKRESGLLPPDPEIIVNKTHDDPTLSGDIKYLLSNRDVHQSQYVIKSHRPYIGKILTKVRHLINEEIKRYVDPLLTRQSEWNKAASRVMSSVEVPISEIDKQICNLNERISAIESLIKTGSFSDDIKQIIADEFGKQINMVLQDANTELRTLSSFSTIVHSNIVKGDNFISNSAITLLEKKDNELINYLNFEDRFRGSRSDIYERQEYYFPFFSGCSHVLDIGCGRGEFLELMRNNGVGAKGIDIDGSMINFCKSMNLDVQQRDAINYLEGIEDNSIDGIFIDQVVEHLEPSYLIRLIQLCVKKMEPGSHIIIETVNPLSFSSLVNFYIDLTHVKPIHPDTIQYLLTNFGLNEVLVHFFSPIPDEKRLKRIDSIYQDHYFTSFSNTYNDNIDLLNSILFGFQDYAVIFKKER